VGDRTWTFGTFVQDMGEIRVLLIKH